MGQILIVEDNKSLAKLISLKVAKETEFEPIIAHSMSEAQLMLLKYKPFLALLDLNLPDAPNGEIVEYIHSKNIPSIILTGNIDDQLKNQVSHTDVVDYVLKERMEDIDYVIAKIERVSQNRNHTIMVVDDSIIARNEMKKYLTSQLYKVYAVSHGEEALNMLREHPNVSLVISDFNMPVMDGLTLTIELRRQYDKNKLAIVGISGDEKTSVSFLRMGANDFIRKPFTKDEFICRVNNTVEALENIHKIGNMAVTDFMTGAYNRRFFMDEAKKYYDEAVDGGEHFALASFDIDNFKSINDTYGHSTGDEVIKFLARSLSEGVKGSDIVARMGGEEFCILLKNISPSDAFDLMEGLRFKISSSFLILKDGGELRFTTSIGLATQPSDSFENMIDASDAYLYKAKQTGKNKVVSDE